MAHDTVAGIRLDVPPDRPGIAIDRVLTAHALAASSGSATFLRLRAGGALIDNDLGAQSRRDDRTLPPGARSLEWSVYCSFSAGPTPCQWSSADDVLHVYKARLFLSETMPPALALTGGSLFRQGSMKGSRTVAFDAEDVDSGLQSVTVTLGGVVAGGARYPCAGTDWSACQRSRRGQILNVDTTAAPDGVHDVMVTATDAANNTTIRAAGEVDVRNRSAAAPPATPAASGAGSREELGTPNGSPASRVAELRLRTTGSRDRNGATLSRYESRLVIRGRLVNAAGRAIADAVVQVLSRHRRAGAHRAHIGTVRTDGGGEFAFRLPAGPSRTVTFVYTAFAGESASGQASVATSVRASIVAARFTPRSPRPGERVTFTGRLKYLPRSEVQVAIQFLDGRRWRTIGLTRTRREGRFTWLYRFIRSSPGDRFVFRAHVSSPIYPFAAGSSAAVGVTLAE